MTRKEATQAVGRVVSWPAMDARIDGGQTILETIGQQGIATVSYRVEGKRERFLTRKPVAILTMEA